MRAKILSSFLPVALAAAPLPGALQAASPTAGSASSSSGASWQGGPFLLPNPSCAGRDAAEPTIGVRKNGTAFCAAGMAIRQLGGPWLWKLTLRK